MQALLDEVEVECFGMEFTYTPVGGTETYGKWNTDKLAWYNAADAERVLAKKRTPAMTSSTSSSWRPLHPPRVSSRASHGHHGLRRRRTPRDCVKAHFFFSSREN